ncbi:MAG: HupE/UreJ family protein [Acidimicrobiia bacterium]|nr:HupE/UreJ family protein [Acidimicrobiia bacterium]MDH5237117.1 HupE/UreJ family protein [Acidimicrobiia bacterium]
MSTTSARRVAALLALATVLLLTGPLLGSASAHTGEQSYIYLQVFDDGVEGRLEFPVRDLNRVLGLDIDEDDRDPALADLAAANDAIVAYVSEHFAIGPGNGAPDWVVAFGDWDHLDVDFGDYAQLSFEVIDPPTPPPRTFSVRFDAIIESIDDYFGLLIIETDWQGGVFNNEADFLLTYRDGRDTQAVDLDNPSFWNGFRGTIELGTEHIFIGTDHILFVLVLLFPSVLVYRQARWYPSRDFRSSFWRVLKIATMFTVAHSITLTLGGLGLLDLQPKLVETVIAASIIAAALHNLHPLYANHEHYIAFGFGLFHGLGFAGLLNDLGLDRTNRVWSLLGFNLGVEIGQLAIIGLVFPILFVLRRTRAYRWLMPLGSIGCAAVAFVWMLERIFEQNLGVSQIVDPLVESPEVFGLLGLAAVVAVGLYLRDRRAGTLRAPFDESEQLDEPASATV